MGDSGPASERRFLYASPTTATSSSLPAGLLMLQITALAGGAAHRFAA